MPKRHAALAGALLLLAACGGREPAPEDNAAAVPGVDAPETASPSDPAQPNPPADGAADPVPPPDAVSHPDGYLPPAPSADASGPDPSAPATEDEYLRNREAGR